MLKMNKGLTVNSLKIIAIVTMFFDHFVVVFVANNILWGSILRIPGRVAAPLMCFFIAEGYHHTSDLKKYIKRLLVFASISHLPYNLLFGYTFFQSTSVIWALAMGLIALSAIKDSRLNNLMKLSVLGATCVLSVTANWNYVAVLWVVVFGLFYGSFKKQILGFTLVGIIFHLIPIYLNYGSITKGCPEWYQIGIFLAIPLLAIYNGKLGNKTKFMSWFFYAFYPGHLILLYLLNKYTSLSEIFRGL